MADKTKIEWADATVNAINGCSLESPGCTNCYAMKQAHRFPVRQGLTVQSKGGMVWTGEVRLSESALLQPLSWKRPRRIFWNAHGDPFHPSVPDDWIDRMFASCALTPQHTHMILTKRSERMREYLTQFPEQGAPFGRAIAYVAREAGLPKDAGIEVIDQMVWPLPNVWLGVSVEDQARADERIPDLLTTPAAVRFISAEPLLGPVDLREVCGGHYFQNPLTGHRWHDAPEGVHSASDMNGAKLDWVICGGESGPNARPMHPDWARSLRDQCEAAGTAFHFKQWGEWKASGEHNRETIIGGPDGAFHPKFKTRWIENAPKAGRTLLARIGKKAAGRLLDGREWDGLPGDQA